MRVLRRRVDLENLFADGYMNVDDDRERYPLTGGYVTLIAAHPSWTCELAASEFPHLRVAVLTGWGSGHSGVYRG